MAGEAINDPRKQAEFDRLINLARINRMRGEYLQADDLVRQALEVLPGNLDARELAADLLYARGQWPEAADAYRSIFTQDPSRTAAEEKYAKVLLQIAEGKRQKDLLQEMLEHPEAHQMPKRSPAVAAVLSGIPGLGHVYCGEFIKAAVILGITAVSWLLFLVLRPNVSFYPPEQRIGKFVENLDPLSVAFLLIALAMHAYAVVNAAVTADKMNSQKQGVL